MKLYLSISIIIFTFTGCTITYKVSESRSPEKFYDKYTSAVENRSVNVTLLNDSTFFMSYKNKIVNDTLYRIKETKTVAHYKIPTEEIKDIDYLSNDYKSADLTLTNGEKLKVENLFFTNDSTTFQETIKSDIKSMICSTSMIRSIEYKNHWKGVIPGILGGTLLGGVLGATGWIIHPMNGGNNYETFDSYGATIFGAVSGLIIGAVVGYIIGFDIDYQFH